MRQATLKPDFVEFIPEVLEDGILYVSQKYKTATHRCCCGCGEEVVTPLGPTDWSLQVTGGAVTLHPSIGNWSFACRSHYWIRGGKVVWAGSMSKEKIEYGRARDQRMRDAYFAEANRQKEAPAVRPQSQPTEMQPQQPDWIDSTWSAFKKWLGF
jgi:hypothetical protein